MKLQEIIGKKVAINCLTQLDAQRVLSLFHINVGINPEWLKCSKWEEYGRNTCYRLPYDGDVLFSPLYHYENEGYAIINSSTFIASNTPNK